MAATGTGADAIRPYLTGATAPGLYQGNPAASLGGARSAVPADSLTVHRIHAMGGVRIEYVSAANGVGIGALEADGTDALRWTPPDDDPGDAVTIPNGATVQICGDDPSKYVVVTRTSSNDLGGAETVQLLDTYGTVCGGSDFDSAEALAGAAKYRAVLFHNLSGETVSGLTVWLESDEHTRIAAETPVSGAVQEIADEDTAPTGLSWVAPTSQGSGLSLGNVAAGGDAGLWIEQSVAEEAPAAARVETVIHYAYTVDSVEYAGQLRGLHRIANDDLERYEVYVGVDQEPDLSGEPDATGTTLPVAVSVDPGHTYYVATQYRNRYGLASLVHRYTRIAVDGEGAQQGLPPSGPALVSVTPGEAGTAVVQASYLPDDDDDPATHWLVYYTTDDTNPLDAEPEVIAFVGGGGVQELEWEAEAGMDGAPIRCVVRTRRVEIIEPESEEDDPVEVSYDSTNTTETTATCTYDGPARPRGGATFGRAAGVYIAPSAFGDPVETVIDGDAGVKWIQGPGYTQLWSGSDLVWNLRYDSTQPDDAGLYTTYAVQQRAVSGTAAAVAEYEAGPPETVYLSVDGERVLAIDLDGAVIGLGALQQGEADAETRQPYPAWGRWGATCLTVWDPGIQDYVCVAALDSSGTLTLSVPWRQKATQEECL